jgi:ribosomal protein S18 acetylase RimI-like enzyme
VFVIEEASSATPEVVEAVAALVPLLSKSAAPVSPADIAEIVGSSSTRLLLARDSDGGGIAGTLTLVLFRIPSGVRAWIEDVIVSEQARGRGCGEALTQEALRIAAAEGARTVELTSRPSREAANRLYQRLGFVRRETNLYRYELGA